MQLKTFHPKILKRNRHYLQVLRLYTDINELNWHRDESKQQLIARGHLYNLMHNQINKATSTPRQNTLKLKPKE